MNNNTPLFADTTVVYYILHSHPLLQNEVRRLADGRQICLSNFVRGEYIRGFVIGLLELYFILKEEDSVENGLQVFTSKMGGHSRVLANALQSIAHWFLGIEEGSEVSKTLRRLGEFIRTCVYLFDEDFTTKVKDPLACELGVLTFPKETYDENQLLDFYEEFQSVIEDPTCDQCVFRQNQMDELSEKGVDLYSEKQQDKYKKYKSYVGQAKNVDKAVRSNKSKPSCWYCQRLGDTIISLSTPNEAIIFTGDKQSFPALAEILGKEILVIPSLSELRKKRDEKMK